MRSFNFHLSTFIFILTGWLVQIATFCLTDATPISLISGMFGICSVVLCSQGNIWTFFFGFGQIVTYSYICWEQALYASLAMNAFYFVSQIYGIYIWRTRQKEAQQETLPTRALSVPIVVGLTVVVVAVSALAGWLLSAYTSDQEPYLDAATTVPAIVAQVLLVLAFREHWFIWLAIDLIYLILWARVGDWCMFAQYLFWCLNAVYGLVMWFRRSK